AINGRVLEVGELIVSLTSALETEWDRLLAARRDFLSAVESGKAAYGFASLDLVVEDADGNRKTAAEIRRGMIDNFLGKDTADRWRLNAGVPVPAALLRSGLQGAGPCDDLGMAIGAVNAGRA